jgi:hypothetical protein
MQRKFIRALVVVLAAFALVAFVHPDDLWDDAGYTPGEMLQESPVTIPPPREQQAGYASQFAASSKSTCSPSSEARTMSPTLVSLSTCVLRC